MCTKSKQQTSSDKFSRGYMAGITKSHDAHDAANDMVRQPGKGIMMTQGTPAGVTEKQSPPCCMDYQSRI
jgi:hypothetical protein